MNALDRGQLPPSSRRQRSVIGRTNRALHQVELQEDAIAVIMRQPAQQARSLSSLGVRRSGSPGLLRSSPAAQLDTTLVGGLSNASYAHVQSLASRSLTPVLCGVRYQDDALRNATDDVYHKSHTGIHSTHSTPLPADSATVADSVVRAALSAPRRTGAQIAPELRASLLTSPAPLQLSTTPNPPVQRTREDSSEPSAAAVKSMQRFLRVSSAENSRRAAPIDPLQEPYVVTPKLRQELTNYHDTTRITATVRGCGTFATADERFDPSTRSVVGHSHVAVALKCSAHSRQEAVLQRIQNRSQHFQWLLDLEQEKLDGRNQANLAKRSALRERTARVAHETSEREARQLGGFARSNVPLSAPRT